MQDWISKLFEHKDLLRMGHCQSADDLNLGMGWLYYAFVRLLRPRRVVVIGSYRGFSPSVFGRALADNGAEGSVYFIDPSFVDDFWVNESQVKKHFADFGLTNVRHFHMTTQQFVGTEHYQSLGEVGIVFVDGYHSAEQARFDYEAFRDSVSDDGLVLFHDSTRVSKTKIYGEDREYERTVRDLMDELKQDPSLQVFDLPFAHGLTLVRRAEDPAR